MDNIEFSQKKDYQKLEKLINTVQSLVSKELNIDFDKTLISTILSYFNVNKQIYIRTKLIDKDMDLTEDISLGYTIKGDLVTRRYCIPITGNIDLGYIQNKKILRHTVLKSDLVILRYTKVIYGFDQYHKYRTKYQNNLVILRRV